MKKFIKVAICMGLIAALLLSTACGGNNGSSGDDTTGGAAPGADRNDGNRAPATATGTPGRFVERDISPPTDGQFMTFITDDSSLVAFDQGLHTRYDSTDGGETWTQSQGPGSGTDRFMGVQVASLMPCGSLLVHMFGEGITKIDPSGNATDFPIESIDSAVADGDMVMVSLIEVLGEDRLLLSYTIMGGGQMHFGSAEDNDDDEDENDEEDGDTANQRVFDAMNQRFEQRITLLDLSGTFIAEIPSDNLAAAAVAYGDYFYVSTAWESMITRFYLANGARTNHTPISLGDTNNRTGFMVGAPSGSVLAIDNNGNLLVLSGTELLMFENEHTDTVLDGNAFSFGAPNSFVSNIIVLACGNIAMNVSDGMVTRLLKYLWDENAVINPERTLHVWSLENSDTVRATITELRRRYPDSYITYEVALMEDTAMSASDAIRTLNTRLLSGRGPDILILDGTPIDSYAGRGMLLDLTGRVDTSGIYQNLLAPYLNDGQMHVIPTQFAIPALMGGTQALAEVPTLAALVESVINGNPAVCLMAMREMLGGIPEEERATIGFEDLEELFGFMWYTSASAFIDDNRLDSDVLREFLAVIQAISDMYGLTEEDDNEFGIMMSVSSSAGGRMNMITGSLMDFMMQATNLAAFPIGNIPILYNISMREDAEVAIFPGLTHGAWLPAAVVGVSADTSVEDFAITFVNTMLSLEVQQQNHGEGLPVTRAAIQAQIDQMNTQMAEFDMDPLNIDIDALINQLQTPALIETTLRDMIWGTVERLGTGRVDIEGAVQEVEQNIRNYLAERS